MPDLNWRRGADTGRYIAHDNAESLTYLVVRHAGRWHLTVYGTDDLRDREAVTFHDLKRHAVAAAEAYAALGADYRPADHGGKNRLTTAELAAYDADAPH